MQNQNAQSHHSIIQDLKINNEVSQNPVNRTTNLHQQFIKLGREKHRIEYQLLQLLPAIFESEIYKKYAHTIEGYAWRFAQLSASVVQKRLRLEKHLEDKPALKAAIAEVGVHKVALVASIATAETDETFADKVLNMSKPAVQELSKELRDKGFREGGQKESGRDKLQGSLLEEWKNGLIHESGQEVQESLLEEFPGNQMDLRCKARAKIIKLELNEELTFMFLKIKQKIGKDLSHRETIRKIFEKILSEQATGGKIKGTNKKEITKQIISDEKTRPIKNKVIPGDNLNIENFTVESGKNVIYEMDLNNNTKSNLDSKSIISKFLTKASTITTSPVSKVEGDPNSLESLNSPRPTFETEPLNNREEKRAESYFKSEKSISVKPSSRHIPVHQKSLALSQSNNHCSYPHCNKPAEILHHPERFSKTRNHKNIKPLCKIHHEFMHNGIVENEEKNAEEWQLNLNKAKDKIDSLYQEYRHKALK